MNELNKEQLEVFKILQSLPKPAVNNTSGGIGEAYQQCAACPKPVFVGDFKKYNSGVLQNVISPLCADCEKDFAKEAKLACCNCNTVIGWIKPHKDKDGFIFNSSNFYHIQACPSCTPGLDKSDIIEKVIYLKKLNNKYHV